MIVWQWNVVWIHCIAFLLVQSSISRSLGNEVNDLHHQPLNVLENVLHEHYRFPHQRSAATDIKYSLCSHYNDPLSHFLVRNDLSIIPTTTGGGPSESIVAEGWILGASLSQNSYQQTQDSIMKVEFSFALQQISSEFHYENVINALNTLHGTLSSSIPHQDFRSDSLESINCLLTNSKMFPSVGGLFAGSCDFDLNQLPRKRRKSWLSSPRFKLRLNLPSKQSTHSLSFLRYVKIALCSLEDASMASNTALSKRLLQGHGMSKRFYHTMIACTAPLQNIHHLEKRWPGIVDQWLSHHIYLMGFGQIFVYDSDGSAWEYVKEFVKLGLVRYYGEDFIEQFLRTASHEHGKYKHSENSSSIIHSDLLLQSIVENHCLWASKGNTEWLLLSLSSPTQFFNDYALTGKELFNRLDGLSSNVSYVSLHEVKHSVRRLPYHQYGRNESHEVSSSHVFSMFPYVPLIDSSDINKYSNPHSVLIVDPHHFLLYENPVADSPMVQVPYRDLKFFIRDYSDMTLPTHKQLHTLTNKDALVVDIAMEKFGVFHDMAKVIHDHLCQFWLETQIDQPVHDESWADPKLQDDRIKLVIIAPGMLAIPPVGYGAVEIIIWNYFVELNTKHLSNNNNSDSKMRDFDVTFVNTREEEYLITQIDKLEPEVIHIQLEVWAYLTERLLRDENRHNRLIIITIHSPFLTNIIKLRQSNDDRFDRLKESEENREVLTGISSTLMNLNALSIAYRINQFRNNIVFFVINEKHKEVLATVWNLPIDRIYIVPNGVEVEKYEFVPDLSQVVDFPYVGRSVSMGKIEARKGQYYVQSILSEDEICFIGPPGGWKASNRETAFDYSSPTYLGGWKKESLYANLTQFANLVHLASDEGAPLAVVEALAAGLGVVITRNCSANLDLSKPFITVIPDDKLQDREYVIAEIRRNRAISLTMRTEIREYARQHLSWSEAIIPKYRNLVNHILAERPVTRKGEDRSLDWLKKYHAYNLIAYGQQTTPPTISAYFGVVTFIDNVSSKLLLWIHCLRLQGVDYLLIYTFPSVYEESLKHVLSRLIAEGFVEVQFLTDFAYYQTYHPLNDANKLTWLPDDPLFYTMVMNEAVSYFRLRGITWILSLCENDYIIEDTQYSAIAKNSLKLYLAQQEMRNIDILILVGKLLQKLHPDKRIDEEQHFTFDATSRSFARVDRIVYHGASNLFCIDRVNCIIEYVGLKVIRDVAMEESMSSAVAGNLYAISCPLTLFVPNTEYTWNLAPLNSTKQQRIAIAHEEIEHLLSNAVAIEPNLQQLMSIAITESFRTKSVLPIPTNSHTEANSQYVPSRARLNLDNTLLFVTYFDHNLLSSSTVGFNYAEALNRLVTILPIQSVLFIYATLDFIELLELFLCPDQHDNVLLNNSLPSIPCSCHSNVHYANSMRIDYSGNNESTMILTKKIDIVRDVRYYYPCFSYYAYIDIAFGQRNDYIPQQLDVFRLLPNKIMFAIMNLPDPLKPLTRIELAKSGKIFAQTSAFIIPNLMVNSLHELWHKELVLDDIFPDDEHSLIYRLMMAYPTMFVYVRTFKLLALFSSYLNEELVYFF